MAICNEPEIPKEIWTLLTKGIAGQLGKSKTMSMIIRFIRPVFPSFSISKGIVLRLMTRSKGMNQRDICDQISRGSKAVGGTGDIEDSNNVSAASDNCAKLCQIFPNKKTMKWHWPFLLMFFLLAITVLIFLTTSQNFTFLGLGDKNRILCDVSQQVNVMKEPMNKELPIDDGQQSFVYPSREMTPFSNNSTWCERDIDSRPWLSSSKCRNFLEVHECISKFKEQQLSTDLSHASKLSLARCVFPFRVSERNVEASVNQRSIPGFAEISRVAYDKASRTFILNSGSGDKDEIEIPQHGARASGNSFKFKSIPYYFFHRTSDYQRDPASNEADSLLMGNERPILCDQIIDVGVFTHADLGAIYVNFWHTISTWLQPMFYALYDSESLYLSDPQGFYLFTNLPSEDGFHKGSQWERYPYDPELIKAKTIAREFIASIFGGNSTKLTKHMIFTDVQDPDWASMPSEGGHICIDRMYFRTNRDYDPNQYLSSACCANGVSVTGMQRNWRTFIFSRFQITFNDKRAEEGTNLRVLWISRASATTKHIVNENELISHMNKNLHSQGFPPVSSSQLEHLSEKDQVQIIASCDILVAFRGAGMTSAVFLRPDAVFLYIGSQGFMNANGLDQLWFTTRRYDPSNLGANPNGENISIVTGEYMEEWKSTLDLFLAKNPAYANVTGSRPSYVN
jgi:hypothetical protein